MEALARDAVYSSIYIPVAEHLLLVAGTILFFYSIVSLCFKLAPGLAVRDAVVSGCLLVIAIAAMNFSLSMSPFADFVEDDALSNNTQVQCSCLCTPADSDTLEQEYKA